LTMIWPFSLLLTLGLCTSVSAQELRWYQVPVPESATLPTLHPESGPNVRSANAATSSAASLARSVAPEAQYFDELIAGVAQKYAVDPMLVHAVIRVESNYQEAAVSGKGAIGLMQVLPATGIRFGKTALDNPRDNLEAGVAYLSWLMHRFDGRLDLALAGYNAGEGAVARYGNAIPPYVETQTYVRKVLANYSSADKQTAVKSLPAMLRDASTLTQQRGKKSRGFGEIVRLFIGGPQRATCDRVVGVGAISDSRCFRSDGVWGQLSSEPQRSGMKTAAK
ncbi:lytic transglycosylase domain-containing protein, partial [Paraburkholderia sp. RL17-373-BIF-A]|uniref:lytic transglycosylase domain-containing protein n=1 Tax=Paraburkholderia sp. RL17-373-BIF-A TaxID=3031629 RepID=UPI0038BA4F78